MTDAISSRRIRCHTSAADCSGVAPMVVKHARAKISGEDELTIMIHVAKAVSKQQHATNRKPQTTNNKQQTTNNLQQATNNNDTRRITHTKKTNKMTTNTEITRSFTHQQTADNT